MTDKREIMSNRRKFIKGGVLGAFGAAIFQKSPYPKVKKPSESSNGFPMVISTWKSWTTS